MNITRATGRFTRNLLVGTALATAFAAAVSPADAAILQESPGAVQFNIPAQNLADALTQFARQSGQQLLFAPDLVAGKRSNALVGSFTPREGLMRLLSGSGIGFRTSPSGAYLLRNGAGPGQQTAAVASPNSGDHDAEGNPDIVVTGSRLAGRSDAPVPTAVFTERAIRELGATSLAQVLDYLPQQPFSTGEVFSDVGARTAQLRGFAGGTTLILINGRRAAPSALLGSANTFDLNTIPLSAVERIEVLSTSASAIYGADAVGGVINIILKQNIGTPQIDLYAGEANGGGDDRRASISLGHRWGPFSLNFVADVYERDPLFGRDRELTANQDYTRFGGPDSRSQAANPGTVLSRTGANLPGLTATFAAIPTGSTGVGLTPASFIPTQGTRNRTSVRQFASLIPESERESVVVYSTLDLTSSVQAYVEGLFTHREEVRTLGPQAITNRLVPASNAFNPFGVAVNVNYLITGTPARRTENEIDYFRGVAGLRGQLSGWDWDVSVLHSRERGRQSAKNTISTPALTAALASADPSAAFNPFQDGPGGSQTLLASLIAPPIIDTDKFRETQGSGFVRGSPFSLPAGPLQLVVGGEVRSERLEFSIGAIGLRVNAKRDIEALFGEIQLPLVEAGMDVPLVRELSISLAGRYDHYSDFGGTFNPEIGLTWHPASWLLLRGAYSTSFRAPSIFEANQPQSTFQATVPDPRRNNAPTLVDVTTGGNPNLDPETASSLTMGAVARFGASAPLRLAATYWRIRYRDRIGVVDPLLDETQFADLVVRAAPTPADIAAGLPGILLSVQQVPANFARTFADGMDFEISKVAPLGTGSLSGALNATWMFRYRASDLPNSPPVERVGRYNTAGSIPEWRLTGTLAWDGPVFGGTVAGRYIASYADANVSNVPNGDRVPSQFYLDLQARVNLDRLFQSEGFILSGLSWRVGVINAFDRTPSYSLSGAQQGVGYDLSQGDIRGRFLYTSISKRF